MIASSPLTADFSRLRYAQVWEDADVLLAALDVQPGDVCLSIASAGDNTLALLTRRPARVLAVDLNPAQIACLELRVAAYRRLAYPELLALLGSVDFPPTERARLYTRCRAELTDGARQFWDARPREIAAGIGGAGKFERYLAFFRCLVLPLIHGRRCVARLLAPGRPTQDRQDFYAAKWDTWRWRALFRLFFSRAVMGRLGRDPSFFRYAEGDVPGRLLARTRHALAALDPAANPYLTWILTGRHSARARPFALREENFDAIRTHLDRLDWRLCSLADFCSNPGPGLDRVQRFNLSNVFEYLSPDASAQLLTRLAALAAPGARFVYWNLFTPRRRPDCLAARLRPLDDLARSLHAADQTFFYSDLVIEESIA